MKLSTPSRAVSLAYRKKHLIVFDLDGTLAKTKSEVDAEMVSVFRALLEQKNIAVIGGGKYALFKKQLVSHLAYPKELLARLYLFPTTATSFYRYQKGWKKIYRLELSKGERAQIKRAFREVFKEINYVHPVKTYGKVIEDRGTQVTFSALGQEIVAVLGEEGVRMKEEWTRKNTPLKMRIANLVSKKLPKLEVRAAGFTSIDVTRKGIDKVYGIRQIEKHLHIRVKDMLFIGDALAPGGNDYAVRKTGVDCIAVHGPEDTKKIMRSLTM